MFTLPSTGITFMTWRRRKYLSWWNHLGINPAEMPHSGRNYSRSPIRARRCKSIRWFDDLRTRSNSGTESSPKVLWHRQNFRCDKAVHPRASLGVHSCSSADSGGTEGAPSLFAEVVIKYRDAPARGKIGVAVPLKIIAPPCRSRSTS